MTEPTALSSTSIAFEWLSLGWVVVAFLLGALLGSGLPSPVSWALPRSAVVPSVAKLSPDAPDAPDATKGEEDTVTIEPSAPVLRFRRAQPGALYLVGAGLGDVDLLTVRARDLISTADVVVFDRLISDEIRSLARPDAQVHIAGKVPGMADPAQADMNRVGLEALRLGKSVVRVKIGDPMLFARGGEELIVFRSHGMEPIVVPGLSSALVAPLVSGIPVTHRGVSNQVLITTGRDKGGKFPSVPDFDPSRTLVLLMAVGKLKTLFEGELKPRGYPAELPVSIVEDATLSTERQTVMTLGELARSSGRFRNPAVITIGRVVTALADPDVVAEALRVGDGED
jgi:uroporphyrin-III C-methyltransferase